LNDIERIGRAREGDQAAWEALVSEHQEAIFRLAYLLLGDAQEAEDVAQETFVRAFRALDRFDTDRFSSMRPWLLSIATNLARNRRRSVGRYMAALRRMVQAVPPEEAVASLGERSVPQWEEQTLWQAIKRLRPAEQEIVYMRYFLEMSEADMASALGMPHGTVKSRLHRALSRLRLVVDKEFPALREERQI
jgi:RNA polymerase sigma-70 factor, ECF subfamily